MNVETMGDTERIAKKDQLKSKEEELAALQVWVGQRQVTPQDSEMIEKLRGQIDQLKKELGE